MSDQGSHAASSAADAEALRRRNRRREKPQLSCSLCRKRKLKCDRLNPCGTCSRRGLGLQCSYPSTAPMFGVSHGKSPVPDISVQEKLQQLEGLVISLMQQGATFEIQQDPHLANNSDVPHGSSDIADPASLLQGSPTVRGGSPDISDFHRLRLSSAKSTYVDSSHWTSILDGISELKEQFEAEDDVPISPGTTNAAPQSPSPGLLMFNGCQPVSCKEELLAVIPPRVTADRLISQYFQALDLDSAVIHTGQFTKQCDNKFWEDPSAAPVLWIALLLSMFAFGTISHELGIHTARSDFTQITFPEELDPQYTVALYKEKIIQSLILGDYTHGGPFVVETLIHYVSIEHIFRKDADSGVWLAVGVMVNLAMRMGYHRDPRHFPNISPFDGEMRRRVWLAVCLLDGAISAQVGMPRLIRYTHADTCEPRSLHNTDFDETTTELPPSRPDTERTPILYLVARLRLQSVFGTVCDLISDARPHSDSEVMRIDSKLNETRSRIPECYKWRSMSESITDSATIIYDRMQLEIEYRKTQIILHLKYLVPSRNAVQYAYSRQVVIEAALKLLEFHHIVDEDAKPTGQLFPVRWRFSSSLANQDFLLATVAVCFYLRHSRGDIETEELETIKRLCRRSQGIWIRASGSSSEAAKAAEALRVVLSRLDDPIEPQATESLIQNTMDSSASADQWAYLSYPEYPSSFEMPFSMSYFNSMLDGTATTSTMPSMVTTMPENLMVDPVLGQVDDTFVPASWISAPEVDAHGI